MTTVLLVTLLLLVGTGVFGVALLEMERRDGNDYRTLKDWRAA